MKRVLIVLLFAMAFAYVEAAVVEYLRALYFPGGLACPGPRSGGDSLFPLITLGQLEAMGPQHVRRLAIEAGRELATLVMLAAVGVMAGTNRREKWAHFVIAFGVWDIAYYGWLKVFLGWPEGLMTWDLLFLVPVPWVAPVLAPVIVAVVMVVCGLVVLYREGQNRPVLAAWWDWFQMTIGGLIVIWAFCGDFRNIMQGGLPETFDWSSFCVGLLCGIIGFLRAISAASVPESDS